MRFSKWHALGNTYVLVEPGNERLTPERARELATETDGVVEVLAATEDAADVVIWNRDGSTAELSGNGTRIAARWLADRTGAETVRVRVGERTVDARMLGGGLVEQDMGPVEVGEPETVAGIELIPVSVGNPHAVVRGDPDQIARLGPLLETHPRFPQRTNVQVVRVERRGRVSARVWERGVGETPASGTSAVAVAAATHADGEVTVRFAGGALTVRLENGRGWLTGPAVELRVARQVLVYVHRAGRFLLLRRREDLGGFWQGVTGAPRWGEADDEAARRELREETGLEASPRPIGFGYVLRPEDEHAWAELYGRGVAEAPEEVYLADASPGWEPSLGPEHVEYRWCTLDEALPLLDWQENREALRRAAAMAK
ncbi:MAG: diaminopimelate epimerase [Actinomycetota bacterium]|nr:diaminopimelate epimerase [Actinomycetota bacterium]